MRSRKQTLQKKTILWRYKKQEKHEKTKHLQVDNEFQKLKLKI